MLGSLNGAIAPVESCDPGHRRGAACAATASSRSSASTAACRSRWRTTRAAWSAPRRRSRLPIDFAALRAEVEALLEAAGPRRRRAADHVHARRPADRADRGGAARSRRRSRWPPSPTRRRACSTASSRSATARTCSCTRLAQRAGRRRGAARHAARPRARGADVVVLLRPRRPAAHAAARATTSSTRSRGAGSSQLFDVEERPTTLDDLRARRGGVPGVDVQGGAAGPRDRRASRLRRRARAGLPARSRGASRRAHRRRARRLTRARRHGHRQPAAVRQGGRRLAPAARASTRRCSSTPASTTTTTLSAVFFDELGIPRPDRELRLGTGTNAAQTARMLAALAPLLGEVGARRSCSSTATPTRRSPAAWPACRTACRWRTSRPACGRSTARCPRRSTAS